MAKKKATPKKAKKSTKGKAKKAKVCEFC